VNKVSFLISDDAGFATAIFEVDSKFDGFAIDCPIENPLKIIPARRTVSKAIDCDDIDQW
jgi:hypothetical protein